MNVLVTGIIKVKRVCFSLIFMVSIVVLGFVLRIILGNGTIMKDILTIWLFVIFGTIYVVWTFETKGISA